MPAALPESLRLEAKAKYIAGLPTEIIAKDLNLNPNTVQTWAAKFKWFQDKVLVQRVTAKALETQSQSIRREDGERVRDLLAKAVAQQAHLIASKPAKSMNQLRNTPARQGDAATTKTVIESAALIFGWTDEKSTTLVAIGTLPRFDAPPAQAQEVEVIKPCESAERLLTEESTKPSEPV